MKLPARISKYELQEYLGGGMSEVYKARDTVLGRTVAVKLLTSQGSQNSDLRSRFLLEAKVSSGIAHENVITTHDYGEEEDVPFMVMEFLVGQTLKDVIRSGEDLPLRRRVSYGLQLAKALAHVHSLHLIHRDVKPDNMHVDNSGRLKLMDFGIVKSGEVNLTQPGYALGTPHYVAPELVLGKEPTPLVDVYAFGVVFFELLTGKRAIQADSVEAIFYSIIHEEISYTRLAESGIPEPIQEIVRNATAKDPAKRTPNMDLVVSQLEAWLEANATQQKPLPVSGKRQMRLSSRWLTAVTVFAALVAGGIIYVLQSSVSSAKSSESVIEDAFGQMVLVPAGPFLYGIEMQTVNVPAYYIDRQEVDNEDYESFCKATGRPLPEGFVLGKPGFPVVNVSYEDAAAFALWAGKRLPTDKEWEKAARGSDGRRYPWGDKNDPSLANLADNPDDSWQHVVSADAYRPGRSPFGVLQLIGNVREWTSQRVTPSLTDLRSNAAMVDPPATGDEPWYELKGGSFKSKLAETAIHLNEVLPARYRATDLGFRCVKDVE